MTILKILAFLAVGIFYISMLIWLFSLPAEAAINPIYVPLIPACQDYSKACGKQLDWLIDNFNRVCRLTSGGTCAVWYTRNEFLNNLILIVGPQRAAEYEPRVKL